MASTPWISFGNRLFKRGNAFFIRVRIPRDLQDLYAATGRRSEICETLKTRDRREAERRCRPAAASRSSRPLPSACQARFFQNLIRTDDDAGARLSYKERSHIDEKPGGVSVATSESRAS
jgi:hypothetical protein